MSRNNPWRYDNLHKWKRRQYLKDLSITSRCVRCGELLIPEEFRTAEGCRVPYEWISRNIHLDHMDRAAPHSYNGLAHASCNNRAHRNTGPRTDVPERKWRYTREEFEAKERWNCERLLANHLKGFNSGCVASPCWFCMREEKRLADIEFGEVWKKELKRRRRFEIRNWDRGYRW